MGDKIERMETSSTAAAAAPAPISHANSSIVFIGPTPRIPDQLDDGLQQRLSIIALLFLILLVVMLLSLAKIYASATKFNLHTNEHRGRGSNGNAILRSLSHMCGVKLLARRHCSSSAAIQTPKVGLVNESFQLDDLDEMKSCSQLESPEEDELLQVVQRRSPKSASSNFLSRYFDKKRSSDAATQYRYKQLDPEDLAMSSFLAPEIQQQQQPTTLNRHNRTTRKSLPGNHTSIFNFFTRKRNSLASSNTTTQAAPVTSKSFPNLPVILITDTARLETSVVDLDTFEPEKTRLTRSQIILRYKINERWPSDRPPTDQPTASFPVP